ncbi:MAG: hypothetical protein E6R03_17370 [Hyphomicrobiaceae bacterium]|nr:MAG: hypothetical protein E6R03_17370 [Hyphomicrobiaceae bacterium]
MGVNDEAASQMVSAKIGSIRYGSRVYNSVDGLVTDAESVLRGRIAAATGHQGRSAASIARNVGRDIGEELQRQLDVFAEKRMETILTRLNRVSSVKLVPPSRVPIVKFLGGDPTVWMEDAAAYAAKRAREVVTGDNPNAEDAFKSLRAHTYSIVRSGASAAHNAAVLAIAKANPRAIGGVLAVATLDARTTEHICVPRHGGAWDLATKMPLPWSAIDIEFPGRPPWHFNCRTTLSPIFIGEDVPDMTSLSPDNWPVTKDGIEALGASNVQAYVSRKITHSQMISRATRDSQK